MVFALRCLLLSDFVAVSFPRVLFSSMSFSVFLDFAVTFSTRKTWFGKNTGHKDRDAERLRVMEKQKKQHMEEMVSLAKEATILPTCGGFFRRGLSSGVRRLTADSRGFGLLLPAAYRRSAGSSLNSHFCR